MISTNITGFKRGSKMKCQVPGCKNNHVKVDEGSGIYSGVYLEWKLCHCSCHSRREIQKAKEERVKRLLEKNNIVNPFAGVLSELGKAAG
jgi:hypothetical protein